jgi:glycosyltransferase involved in cell wall biosynthesis
VILITIPYYNSKDTLEASIKSVLEQTYRDFELLVINDGDKDDPAEFIKIKDSRLKFFSLKYNRGRYFCDCIALKACPHEFYLVHDSDDLSDRNRLFYLMRAYDRTNAEVIYNYQRVVSRTGRNFMETYPKMNRELSREMKHIAHWSMLYKTEALREIGGIHPDFRVGYDTLVTNLMKMKYRMTCVPRVLYTRNIRPQSLTVLPESNFKSAMRRQAVQHLVYLYRRCYENPANIKRIIEGDIKNSTKKKVKYELKRLREALKW